MSTQVIDRSAFIRRWSDRDNGGNPIDHFFSLWVALVISARPQLQTQDYDGMDTDRCAVSVLAKGAHESVFREVSSCRSHLEWLAQRKGTQRQDPIVDAHEFKRADHLRNLFTTLATHYSGGDQAKPGRIVEAVVELLNHVRNNLFHGIKSPTDVDDLELLKRLNPLLKAVLILLR